jgi:hypothetical protein
MTSEAVTALVERLEGDARFTSAFDEDAIAALRNEGFAAFATAAKQDRDRIGELVDRIYRDDEFRAKVEQDPLAELIGWGLPEVAIAPLLLVAGAPDEVVERATADVEAHISARKPATVAAVAAVIGTFAFAQQASAASNPAAKPQAAAQLAPQATAQVAPQFTAQLTPQATAQVKPQARVQVSRAAQATWHGIQPQRAKALGGLTLLLRSNSAL